MRHEHQADPGDVDPGSSVGTVPWLDTSPETRPTPMIPDVPTHVLAAEWEARLRAGAWRPPQNVAHTLATQLDDDAADAGCCGVTGLDWARVKKPGADETRLGGASIGLLYVHARGRWT